MALHTLHLTVQGSNFEVIEDDVVDAVARYTRWPPKRARQWVSDHAEIHLYPIDRRQRVGVIYRADITVGV